MHCRAIAIVAALTLSILVGCNSVQVVVSECAPLEVVAVTASTAQPGMPADNVRDGDLDTIWHTPYDPPVDVPPPHELIVRLEGSYELCGVELYRRPGYANGTPAYMMVEAVVSGAWEEVYDGNAWTDPNQTSITVPFVTTTDTLRFTFYQSWGSNGLPNNPWAALAELRPISDDVTVPGPPSADGELWLRWTQVQDNLVEGGVSHYEVRWFLPGQEDTPLGVAEVDKSLNSYIVTGLPDCTPYEAQVRTVSGADPPEYSAWSMIVGGWPRPRVVPLQTSLVPGQAGTMYVTGSNYQPPSVQAGEELYPRVEFSDDGIEVREVEWVDCENLNVQIVVGSEAVVPGAILTVTNPDQSYGAALVELVISVVPVPPDFERADTEEWDPLPELP